jgi:hypothetical protein
MAVEAPSVGDHVVTENGCPKPIAGIGHRAIDRVQHPWPGTVWPMRVSTGAFGPQPPVCDLYLSLDHAVFVNAVHQQSGDENQEYSVFLSHRTIFSNFLHVSTGPLDAGQAIGVPTGPRAAKLSDRLFHEPRSGKSD